ncbi:MAG: hypothetical protein CML45_02985 [Rhodobacteraceae bacterium]|nr:hypothetical protein [Paracoccaceae bacterium]|tara:strand:- start:575 stop:1039 length:465 start_codon:yes stop_codon:yes gene_type:complete
MDIVLNDTTLRVWRNGDVFRKLKRDGCWREVANTPNHSKGYNMFGCGGKRYTRHRIMGYCYLGLDLNDKTQLIDHIDGDKLNNDVMNLRIVTNQENCFNRRDAKGYCWDWQKGKWRAQICIDREVKFLGCWDTEAQARLAYLEAKEKYHLFRNA